MEAGKPASGPRGRGDPGPGRRPPSDDARPGSGRVSPPAVTIGARGAGLQPPPEPQGAPGAVAGRRWGSDAAGGASRPGGLALGSAPGRPPRSATRLLFLFFVLLFFLPRGPQRAFASLTKPACGRVCPREPPSGGWLGGRAVPPGLQRRGRGRREAPVVPRDPPAPAPARLAERPLERGASEAPSLRGALGGPGRIAGSLGNRHRLFTLASPPPPPPSPRIWICLAHSGCPGNV